MSPEEIRSHLSIRIRLLTTPGLLAGNKTYLSLMYGQGDRGDSLSPFGWILLMERLDKFLSNAGLGTRKQIKEFVKCGLVTVDGANARDPGMRVDPLQNNVCFKGERIARFTHTYILLNKPAGCICATEDLREETVMDVLIKAGCDPMPKGLFPVGRLDKDTTGLLLITDDGEFAHELLSPKKHVDKVYRVSVDTPLDEKEISLFKEGIVLSDFTCLPAELNILTKYEAEVTICEGKYHQVKRMFKALGHNVISLKRLRFGKFTLPSDLSEGEYIMISPFEKNA